MDGNISLKESHDIVDKLEKIIQIKEEKAKYITIHVNPVWGWHKYEISAKIKL